MVHNIEVSVSEGLICEALYGHAFVSFDGLFSGVQHSDFTIFCGCG